MVIGDESATRMNAQNPRRNKMLVTTEIFLCFANTRGMAEGFQKPEEPCFLYGRHEGGTPPENWAIALIE